MSYYAVSNGRNTGIYDTWAECEAQVKGYSGATYKKFDSAAGAQNFISSGGNSNSGRSSSNHGNYGNTSYNSNRSYSTSSNYQSGSSARGQYGGSSHYESEDYYSSGYYGDTGNKSNFERDDEGYVQVYTDGACSSNGRSGARAGIGVYWGEKNSMNVSEPVSGRATNNSGEIQAATRAIKQAVDSGVKKLTINTDSEFLIKSATKWMPGWKNNGWKTASGEPVKNESDFKDLDRIQNKIDIKWNHVESHKGVHGNEMADKLAKEGATKYK